MELRQTLTLNFLLLRKSREQLLKAVIYKTKAIEIKRHSSLIDNFEMN